MKFKDYDQFAKQNSDIMPCLNWTLGPPVVSGDDVNPEFTWSEWIEQQVKNLAVQPFGSLNLETTRNSNAKNVEVEYGVWFHIGGEDTPLHRFRGLSQDEPTLRVVIDELVRWHAEYWALQKNRPLVFGAITRHTRCFGVTKYFQESLEVFRFPEGYQAG